MSETNTKKVQLVTIVMTDGTEATFIGLPLYTQESPEELEVQEAWFSTVKELDVNKPLTEMLEFAKVNRVPQVSIH